MSANPTLVTVAHPFLMTVYPRSGSGKVHGHTRDFATTTDVVLEAARNGSAHVVADLPLGDGSVTLRKHGDTFLRPVLAPGTLAPCTVDMFSDAVDGTVSWRDHPFRGLLSDRPASWREDDHTKVPKPMMGNVEAFNPHDWRKYDEDRRGEASMEVSRVASTLVVVDEVVYVPCEEPVLVLKSVGRNKGDRCLRLTWKLPGLEGDDDEYGPTTLLPPPSTDFRSGHRAGYPTRPKEERPQGTRADYSKQAWRVFGVKDMAEATEFASRLASVKELALQTVLPTVLRDWEFTKDTPVMDWKRAANDALQALGQDLASMSDASVHDWVEARRDLRELGDVDGAMARMLAVTRRVEDVPTRRWGETTFDYSGGLSDQETRLAMLVRHAVHLELGSPDVDDELRTAMNF